MGVFNPLETMKYLTSNDCLIDKRMKYFETETIKTNENIYNILKEINI